MSCRQPAQTRASRPRPNSRMATGARSDAGRIGITELILHLHHRDWPEAFEEVARLRKFELGVVGLEAEEELVGGCTGPEIRSIEQWVIGSGKAAQGKHAEGCGKTRPENRP